MGYSWHCKGGDDPGDEPHDAVIASIFVACKAVTSCIMFITVLFLLHLVFTYAKYDSEKCMKDDLLDKQVPVFVYIQNRRLVTKKIGNKLE